MLFRSTRGIFSKQNAPSASSGIDYVTIATLGNAVSFGSLTATKSQTGACASSIRGIFAGGYSAPNAFSSLIEYVTIATTGNGITFGNLTTTSRRPFGCSNGHGGLG